MYKGAEAMRAYEDDIGAPEDIEVLIPAEVKMVSEDPENFDLYEWALEFSKAVGFEVERVPIKIEE